MNLRNSDSVLNIGLDMGPASVGWSATDGEGEMFHFKKQPTWGSRLFDEANTAALARSPRSQRRRYIRRCWRLSLLQKLFKEEMEKTDSEFFIRLRQSRLHMEDREEGHTDYEWPLFNASDFTERDYYNRFPTIYHLRSWLMTADEKADIRLIYLATHNIVKHRGNFLRQENKSLSSKNANPEESLEKFYQNLLDWCSVYEGYGVASKKPDLKKILDILSQEDAVPSKKRDDIADILKVSISENASENKACNKALAGAMVGLKADFKKIFINLEAETTSIKLGEDEKVEALEPCIPDEDALLFQSLREIYSAYVLQGILSYVPGGSISENMIAKYKKYGEDLRILKDLVKEFIPEKYNDFFRGEMYKSRDEIGKKKKIYDASKAQGYTRYNLGTSKISYDDFRKEVEKLFKDTSAVGDPRYVKMMEEFKEEKFLRRLKTSDNGSIPYQLHLEELHAILENQAKHYSFLKADQEKIESLVSFRIPYYVGPLQTKNAAVDHNGKQRFSWAERQPGKEDVAITPWNWDEVINKSASAQKFIERMTGECTYLQGEDVLPRCSLLYEEFCVWNEINGAHFSMGDGEEHRFDAADREAIFELFKEHRTVTYKAVENLLESQLGYMNVRVRGGQGENSFTSSLNSYRFFRKDVFKDGKPFTSADYEMIERIIKWSTLFEDRNILEEKLEEEYGDRLDNKQIKLIKKKRFAGWGNLSKKFLTGVKVQTNCGKKSIMDVLREGNPNVGGKNNAMVLMQVLRNEELGFQDRIDKINEERYREIGKALQVNELPGSPAIRRSINQAIRIVDEIVKIHGAPAKNIFIEVTRADDFAKKGSRTKTRYKQLEEATKKFKEECSQEFDKAVLSELKDNQLDLDNERLVLYFAQHGKCLYSGKPLDISQLSSYEVDHIIPRSYVKDDSFDNKALVIREANQAKTDQMLIPANIRKRMGNYWRMLHDAGLISDKKFNNLMRDHINEKAMKGFIARQLVETSQMVKLIQQVLRARYPETNVIAVKASMSHDLRVAAGFVKCREANDFHHAHDAYLACRIGLFIQKRHPKVYEQPIAMAYAMEKYIRNQSKLFAKDHNVPGSSSFIVNSFMTSGFDPETGEVFKDDWNAEAEIESIRKALNYRQCFITRMPYEEAGAFWDATIYSPRDPKMGPKLALSLKKGLNPKKYGGFSSQKFAYFFVYRALDKRGNSQLRVGCVPVYLADSLKDEESLLQFAQEQARDLGLEFLELSRSRLLKRQLVEIEGDRYLVNGSAEMLNARQLALSQEEQVVLLDAIAGNIEDSSCLDRLFERICKEGDRLGKRISAWLNEELIDSFKKVSCEEKTKTLVSLIAWINGKINGVDFSALGKSKNYGKIRPQRNGLKCELFVIDQSVTGMFERRTHIGL